MTTNFDSVLKNILTEGVDAVCFSPEASFTMGSLLGIIWAATCRKVKRGALLLIAAIPLFFAVQQLAEGFVWLNMHDGFDPNPLSISAKIVFLIFAWIIWPLYIPLAFFFAEKAPWRKGVCAVSFLIGLGIAYVDIRFLVNEPFVPTIVGNSLYYPASPFYANIIYGLAVLPPILLSGIPKMWAFGVILLVSYLSAMIIWQLTFTSVWCFFAAGMSLMLYYVLIHAKEDVRL